jgi:curli biogenesis system outer membrane secretion channel CsgG
MLEHHLLSRLTGATVAAVWFATAGLAQPVSDAPMKTVAVDQFLAAEAVGGSVTADGLTAMLIDALSRDGRFVVVERTGLASVQTEQGLGTSSAATAETAAKTGQLIGASVIIRGAVIKYEAARSGGSLGVGGFGLGSLLAPQAGLKHSTATLEISLRLIDTTTGQIIVTYNAEGSAGANSAGIDLVNPKTGLSLGASAFSNTPLGQAAQDAILKCLQQIGEGMRKVPWSSTIVEAAGGKIYVSGGTDRHIAPGLVLTVVRKGKIFTDPSTGQVLDVEMDKIGTIKIDGVREKISTATLLDGQMPVRGDIVKLD